jgi:hypothetical protein
MVRRVALFVVAGALAAAGGAWAGTGSHSVDVKLEKPTIVSGQKLPPGDYQLSWTGDSSPVEVAIERGSKTVAKVDAKVEQLAQPSPNKELITRAAKDGSRALEEVRLGGKKTALVFPVS